MGPPSACSPADRQGQHRTQGSGTPARPRHLPPRKSCSARTRFTLLVSALLRGSRDQLSVRRSRHPRHRQLTPRCDRRTPPLSDQLHTCPPCALIRWLRVLASISSPSRVLQEVRRTTVDSHECGHGLGCSLNPMQALFPSVRKAGWVSSGRAGSDVVSQVVKERVAAIGLDRERYSGHSLRAGFVTQAFRSGASTHEMMRQTGHRSPATVEIYSREIDPMLHNAVGKLGL
jgi:hypothetical protein